MPPKAPFVRKLLKRLDKIDRDQVQGYLEHLAAENAFLHEILQELGEGIIRISRQGHLLYANRQAAVWLGLPVIIPPNTLFTHLIADRGLAGFVANHLPALVERTVSDFNILTPREIDLRVLLMPIANGGSKETLMLLQSIEKTEAGAGNTRNDALMRLAAGIAHEIGNPLNSISIHLQLLGKDLAGIPEPVKKNFVKTLEILYSETGRLDKIIKNFLKAVRKPPLRFKTENLGQVLSEALVFMRPELEARGISTELRDDPAIPFFLMDRERLYQAFLNLIKNAMESMPKGGSLVIALSRRDNLALITFKDRGIGIDESALPRIFEAYYTTKEAGSGLGLMTVLNAVREHGGRIEVSSKPGKGTAFLISLPIRQPKFQLPSYPNR